MILNLIKKLKGPKYSIGDDVPYHDFTNKKITDIIFDSETGLYMYTLSDVEGLIFSEGLITNYRKKLLSK